MANQHDKIFKQLLHAFLDDFLRLVVPETFDRLDLSSPEFLDKELFERGPRADDENSTCSSGSTPSADGPS